MKRIKVRAKLVPKEQTPKIPKKYNNLLILQLMDERNPGYCLWNGIIIRVATLPDIVKANNFLKTFADTSCSDDIYLTEADLNPFDDATYVYAVDDFLRGLMQRDRYIIRRIGTIEEYLTKLYQSATEMENIYRNLPLTFVDTEKTSVKHVLYDAVRKPITVKRAIHDADREINQES